jgi:hypothetical protein
MRRFFGILALKQLLLEVHEHPCLLELQLDQLPDIALLAGTLAVE